MGTVGGWEWRVGGNSECVGTVGGGKEGGGRRVDGNRG